MSHPKMMGGGFEQFKDPNDQIWFQTSSGWFTKLWSGLEDGDCNSELI